MSEVVTLAERQRRKMDRIQASIVEIDASLTDYARRNAGRFIRFGSTARGGGGADDDVDIIAHFADDGSLKAASFAEEQCLAHGLVPDVRPSLGTSSSFLKRVAADGIILE